jgi:hypothetical protein
VLETLGPGSYDPVDLSNKKSSAIMTKSPSHRKPAESDPLKYFETKPAMIGNVKHVPAVLQNLRAPNKNPKSEQDRSRVLLKKVSKVSILSV